MKDLYIVLNGEQIGLRKFDDIIGQSIDSGKAAGHTVFEVDKNIWSAANNNLPDGVKAVYVSGLNPPEPIKPESEIKVAGAVGLFREDQGQQKAYRNLLIQSGDSAWFYGNEFKNFPDHYYTGTHPTGSIW